MTKRQGYIYRLHGYAFSASATLPTNARNQFILVHDNWDDWFEFETVYNIWFADSAGKLHHVGSSKIGQFGTQPGQRSPGLPDEFNELGPSFFSLAQDVNFYEKLTALGGADYRTEVCKRLNDVAYDLDLFQKALDERVTGISLLRAVPRETVYGQFHRVAHGGVVLDKYTFAFLTANASIEQALSFTVDPTTQPPTNIHVLIGRNGVGKTRLLRMMTRALIDEDRRYGLFAFGPEGEKAGSSANLVSVSFSAFDRFAPLPEKRDKSKGMQYSYIGLKQQTDDRADDHDLLGEWPPIGAKDSANEEKPPKSPTELTEEFIKSVRLCKLGEKKRVGDMH